MQPVSNPEFISWVTLLNFLYLYIFFLLISKTMSVEGNSALM